jgi:hypothetical protein
MQYGTLYILLPQAAPIEPYAAAAAGTEVSTVNNHYP